MFDHAGGPKLLIGDGRSDECLAGEADFVFATAKLLRHCQAHGLPHLAFQNFAEARGHLAMLMDLPVMAAETGAGLALSNAA